MLAQATVEAALERGLEMSEAVNFQASTGKGVQGVVEGMDIRVGSLKHFEGLETVGLNAARQTVERLQSEGKTTVLAAQMLDEGRTAHILGLIAYADRLRPKTLDEVIGQDHLLGEGLLGRMVRAGRLNSVIFWGPPGTGKTTVARLLAEVTDLHFEQLSAIQSGVADLRKVFDAAKAKREAGRGTLLFIDEIHRFNRSQQDAFLPHMEDGTIVLVGATTENPSFELNSALLSRASVLSSKDEGSHLNGCRHRCGHNAQGLRT